MSASKEPPKAWVWVLANEIVPGDTIRYRAWGRDTTGNVQSVIKDTSEIVVVLASGDTYGADSDKHTQAWRPIAVDMPCTVRVGSDLYSGKVEHVTPAGQKIVVRGEAFFKKADGSYQRRSKRLILGYAEDYMDPHF